MSIDSEDDLIALRRVGRLVGEALAAMEAAADPAMTIADLDAIGTALLRRARARSAPQMVYGFLGFNLVSVNAEIVHGMVVEDADGWTLRTHNRALAAHFEETIAATSGAPLTLTSAA